jgi:hypothetical protein
VQQDGFSGGISRGLTGVRRRMITSRYSTLVRMFKRTVAVKRSDRLKYNLHVALWMSFGKLQINLSSILVL